jgi:hypothetical protein
MRRGRAIATSVCVGAFLFGECASLADTYVSNVTVLQSSNTHGQLVTLGGYSNVADGGGGVLYPSATGCTQNFGTVFKDGHGNCLIRVKPTNSVREWGAYCDVVAV